MKSLLAETWTYAARVRQFRRPDWLAYVAWVGLMLGLFFSVGGFILGGWRSGVDFPAYVWNVPLGTLIFVVAIAFDTIGHRTVYAAELAKGEALVHHITIFAGISSCLALCLAYPYREFWEVPAGCLVVLSIFYSVIDEALHWRRYLQGHSDRVEMWSHFFIFLGHAIMMVGWWKWFAAGYPGVPETLSALGL